jgi:hypothetical protein
MKPLVLLLALAAGHLSLAHAERAIATYEAHYWHGEDVAIEVGSCRRRSARQITCVATVSQRGLSIRTEDWATLIQGGDIRVHPGKFTEVSS